MSKQLIATQTKFICGARAYRLWLEADVEHPDIGTVFNEHIRLGRKVVVPESRGPAFAPRPPIPLPEPERTNPDEQATKTVIAQQQPAGRPSALAGIPGVTVSSDYDESEESAGSNSGGPAPATA